MKTQILAPGHPAKAVTPALRESVPSFFWPLCMHTHVLLHYMHACLHVHVCIYLQTHTLKKEVNTEPSLVTHDFNASTFKAEAE